MELELRDGDYLADGAGGLRRVEGREALLQRIFFRLTARRGTFPFWESLGSRLWTLGNLPAPERRAAARQFVAEALEEEPVTVTLEEGWQTENLCVYVFFRAAKGKKVSDSKLVEVKV